MIEVTTVPSSYQRSEGKGAGRVAAAIGGERSGELLTHAP
ncbi:hypothetical protein ACVWWN_003511 [Mycobacterium sp. URHB0021]